MKIIDENIFLRSTSLAQISTKANYLIVFCHGYGADGKDLINIGNYWQRFLPDFYFTSPNAPNVCSVNPSGFEWFNLMNPDIKNVDLELESSVLQLTKFIDAKLKDLSLDYSKLFLVGFSQGTMMSLHYALTNPNKIAGVIGYSGKIYDPSILENNIKSRPPIFLMHGDSDNIVPLEDMMEAKNFLTKNKVDLKTKIFKGCGHSIPTQGLSLGLEFININK
ncbi:MAG: alpha/beta fold hydrolase [Pseudomonadota bacterium]|jgi:phospholipase/carboxylesterase